MSCKEFCASGRDNLLSRLQATSSVECVTGTTENISNLVSDQFFDFRSSWAKIFARIELFWRFPHHFSNCGGHGEPEVSVDVNFGAAKPTGDFDVGFRHSRRVFSELATVLVDFLNEVFGNAGSSMENQRIVAQARIQQRLFDCL